jgi:trehalose 6-phosphate phosphatase
VLKTPIQPDAEATALFLDVDGTLLDIREHPADVVADHSLIDLLGHSARRVSGALCLITGRALDDVDRIFAPARFPTAGAHGAEIRLPDGRRADPPEVLFPDAAFTRLARFVESQPGLLLEKKHGGASLHYRKAPQLADACHDEVHAILAEIGDDFRLIAGKMVFEIAPGSHDKGKAIATFMENNPFAGRQPVFLGDDVTDEDGFQVVNAQGGISIVVGDRENTQARYRLPDVESVRTWLRSSFLAPKTEKELA